MNRVNKIEIIAEHYGYDAQSRQCIEEMAELTQAINKMWRKSEFGQFSDESIAEHRDSIWEEIADVQIMLYQMIWFLGNGEDINTVIDRKLDRQLERIKEE